MAAGGSPPYGRSPPSEPQWGCCRSRRRRRCSSKSFCLLTAPPSKAAETLDLGDFLRSPFTAPRNTRKQPRQISEALGCHEGVEMVQGCLGQRMCPSIGCQQCLAQRIVPLKGEQRAERSGEIVEIGPVAPLIEVD